MALQIQGFTTANVAEVDSNKNLMVSIGDTVYPSAGGFYTVTGQQSSVVAASLASSTTLMSMRFSTGSTRKAYLDKFRVVVCPATVGVSAGVPGTLGLQRFTTATPSGGTARTADENDEVATTATDMTDIRDSNAALTVTSVVFGNIAGVCLVPNFTTGGSLEWIFEPITPIKLTAGDGLCLRTQVAMPGTQTWVYSYTAHWHEK